MVKVKNSTKLVNTLEKTDKPLVNSLPWDEIEKISKEEQFRKKFRKVEQETFLFAAKKEHRSVIIESALKSLQKSDPDNATYEKAASLADIMQVFAKKFVKIKSGKR
ncbi:MAG: hypothetical protein H0W89_08035 [Candidatus Levybacteria bacterium]|nr:hypothetical protein [Candidatus Levybacteria bacterium]